MSKSRKAKKSYKDKKKMARRNTLTVVVLGLAVFIFVIIFMAYSRSADDVVDKSTNKKVEAPKIKADKLIHNFGAINATDNQHYSFSIENVGTKTLLLMDPRTSCHCTSVIIRTESSESPVFSMHDSESWTGRVEPGEKAEVAVIYDPKVHKIQQKTERSILIKTNDPKMRSLMFRIRAEPK